MGVTLDLFRGRNIISKKFSIGLSAAVLLTTLFFGLNPKGFHINNNVSWIANQAGICFGKYGIAYTDSTFEPFRGDGNTPQSLSFEIALKPDNVNNKEFKFILVLYNGDDARQLLIGQWRSSIILMNGNDYDNKKRTKKIWVKQALLPQKTRFVTITSEKEGTKIYLDGYLVATKKDLLLKVPDGSAEARLVVGNSVYGKHSWIGDIYGLAIYDYALLAKNVKLHFEQWSKERNFAFVKKDIPQALYTFDEKTGERAFDRAGGNHHLTVPRRMQILKREILVAPWHGVKLNRSFVIDIILNLVGFIPVGFVLNSLFVSIGGSIKKYSAVTTVLFCLIISLFIEIAQAWMPSRCSQLLDLMLNSVGALLGVMLYRFSLRFSREWGHSGTF